jgi:CheY-like chemotaxis protein
MTEPIRIIIAERNPDLREQLALLLNSYDGLLVVGTAATGTIAVDLCTTLQPDVILLDPELPIIDGFTAAKLIRQQCPRAIIIMYGSTYIGNDNDASLDNVSFILTKPTATERLINVIRSLHTYSSPSLDANNPPL